MTDAMVATKVCNECGEEKPAERFPKRSKPGGGRRLLGHCWTCHAARHNARHKRWRDSEKGKKAVKGYKLKYLYDISLEQYDEMLARQNGRCAICARPPLPRKKLGVDHDHRSGDVRGLLCDHCNKGLGSFGDDCELMYRAIAYLGGE